MSEEKMMQEIKELQQIELGILLDVVKVCEKYNIRYFLGEGTLLGAIRHKGFIPWDDDVDLIMHREDYEEFLKVAQNELGERYHVQHPTTVKDYWSPFTKIRLLDTDRKYTQQHIAHLTTENGPYIDIFPMEYIPEKDSFRVRFVNFKLMLYRGMLSYKLGLRKPPHWYGKLLKFVSNFVSVKFIHRGLARNFVHFGPERREYTAIFSSYHPFKCKIHRTEDIEKAIPWEFEGHMLCVPDGYDKVLTTIYGDYMTPPPPEKRIIKHSFDTRE